MSIRFKLSKLGLAVALDLALLRHKLSPLSSPSSGSESLAAPHYPFLLVSVAEPSAEVMFVS